MTEHVNIQKNGAVLEILFAPPEKKNALSNALYRAVSDALESAGTNNTIRVVLFGAEGDRFTAGNDLVDFAAVATGASAEPRLHQASCFRRALATLPPLPCSVSATAFPHSRRSPSV